MAPKPMKTEINLSAKKAETLQQKKRELAKLAKPATKSMKLAMKAMRSMKRKRSAADSHMGILPDPEEDSDDDLVDGKVLSKQQKLQQMARKWSSQPAKRKADALNVDEADDDEDGDDEVS